jgi:hypothetical protein
MIIARQNSNRERAVGLSRDFPSYYQDIRSRHKVIPDATSHALGWIGLQAVRYRNLATNEMQVPALSQHLLMLHTKAAAEVNFRYDGGERERPAPVGSITAIPVGSVLECCWRGTKDAIHIYLDPKLIARVATTSFELDLARTAVPPLDALILPEVRTAMLAADAELRAGGLGGPLIIESLATILAVRLIRHVFGRRYWRARPSWKLVARRFCNLREAGCRPLAPDGSLPLSVFDLADTYKLKLKPWKETIRDQGVNMGGVLTKSLSATPLTCWNPRRSAG